MLGMLMEPVLQARGVKSWAVHILSLKVAKGARHALEVSTLGQKKRRFKVPSTVCCRTGGGSPEKDRGEKK